MTLLQPYTTFSWSVPCELCHRYPSIGTRMACLPDDDSYDTSDPWGCEPCVENDPDFAVAETDADWKLRVTSEFARREPTRLRGSEHGNRYSETGVEILTRSGKTVSLKNPDPATISMFDIAYGLASQVRFSGQCPLQPTIAQHSLATDYIGCRVYQRRHTCNAVPPAMRKALIMHDASEYLIGDATGGLKKLMRMVEGDSSDRPVLMSAFDVIEEDIGAAIIERFPEADPTGWEDIIHEADKLACDYEMFKWHPDAKPPHWMLVDETLRYIYETEDGGFKRFMARTEELGMVD